MFAILALATIAAIGCGGASAVPDAGQEVDAMAEDAAQGCTPTFGRTFFLDVIEFLGAGEGYDRNGDGEPDNALWLFGLYANPWIKDSIATGNTIVLADVFPWPELVPEEPTPVRFVLIQGNDADDPVDPTNNGSGEGRFTVPRQVFDTDCEPLHVWDRATFQGYEVAGETRSWKFLNLGSGTVEFFDALAWARFDESRETLVMDSSAVWTLCSLYWLQMPGSNPGTMLEFIANEMPDLTPDIDRDGDGFERVVGDGAGHVLKCIDGDGTEIERQDCACDPRIADGYSVAVRGHGVLASIVGFSTEE